MKRDQITILWIASASLALATSACGGGGGTASAPSQSPTFVLATPAPLPTTETPVGAGPTLPAASVTAPGSLPQDLAKAVFNTKGVLAVRFELNSNVTFTKDGKQVTQQGINVKGEGNGPDQDLTFSSPNLATGEVETFEMIKIGDLSYVKGLSFGQNLDANTWYQLTEGKGGPQGSTPNPQGILSGMNERDFLSVDLKAAGIGVVDAQSCQVWASQNSALAKEFGSLTNNPDAVRQLSAVDTFQVNLWTCPDGYLHQVQGAVSGHDPKAPAEQARVEFGYHFYDFGAKISITAPVSPQPIPIIGPILTSTP
jgi:hypothetical protein